MLERRTALRLILADNCDFPWKGRIENALNQVDPKTGTLELQARFPNPQHNVLPGQFGRIRVQTEERRNAIAGAAKGRAAVAGHAGGLHGGSRTIAF